MTPWSRGGSLTSDRLGRQSHSQQSPQQLNKGKQTDSSHIKSKEVQKLEQILHGLQRENPTRDPTGSCFCQARTHSLSKYTPNCLNCGLALCALHLPFHLCPHCSTSLTDHSSRIALIQRVEGEIEQVLKKEEEERIREQRERERAAGAFPTLAAATGSTEHRNGQPRNVISLNSRTGKATMATYSTRSTSTRSTATPSVQSGEKETRQPPPPSDVDHIRGKILEPTSWKNLRNGFIYIAPHAQ